VTDPTPDSSGNIIPGLYHAEGDPLGTVRQWDGTQWIGGPVPTAPGSPSTPASLGSSKDSGNFADAGVRIGAILIDGIIFLIIAAIATLPFLEDTNPDSDSFEFEATGTSAVIGPIVVLALTILLVATRGGSPGKLLLGLRVTLADGTTPIGFGPAAMRSVPWLPTLIPLFGMVVWVALVITSLVFISNDPERRSVFDRAANTRVVRK
jgi:uncharacterized RDD family membrane protein YckC